MHLLDEEELAHVGKVLRRGYVRIHRKSKKERVKEILFGLLFSLLALLFLALSVYCIYWVVNGSYFFIAFPGFILSAVLFGFSLREIHLSLDSYPLLFARKTYVKSLPNFIPDPDEHSPSHQSSSSFNQSSHSHKSDETTSIFKSTSDHEVVEYSTFEEHVQFGRAPNMIKSVSQSEVDQASNEDRSSVKAVGQSSFSSSRKRFFHNFESEESLVEMKTLPVVESQIPMEAKEFDRGSSQSLPAIKFM